MNTIRNMEAVFVIALGLACSAIYVLDAGQDGAAQQAQPLAQAQQPARMPVVVVTARRMTPEQKRQSLEQERLEAEKLASARQWARSRT